jgi:hypothetical protein
MDRRESEAYDRFVDDLKRALGDYRSKARQVAPSLWNAVQAIQSEHTRSTSSTPPTAEAIRMRRISRLARELLESLPQGSTVGEFLQFPFYVAAEEARTALGRLKVEAERSATTDRRRARRGRGRPIPPDRNHLCKWVALQLAGRGVTPTSTKNGPFTKVLSVVQRAAGFPERQPENLWRDALGALKNIRKDPQQSALLTSIPATTQLPRRKMRIL